MKKILPIILVCFSVFAFSQNPNEEIAVYKKDKKEILNPKIEKVIWAPASIKQAITLGFSTGNAPMVSSYFSQNIDITLLNKENLYSKSQAEQVLKTFFNDNPPTNFKIIHEGKSNNTKYFIGSLDTKKGTFRITINIKSLKGKEVITHLTIEK
ncbi:MAG: DUF4783 domain-containing protein [Putridiphycobacter sp.]